MCRATGTRGSRSGTTSIATKQQGHFKTTKHVCFDAHFVCRATGTRGSRSGCAASPPASPPSSRATSTPPNTCALMLTLCAGPQGPGAAGAAAQPHHQHRHQAAGPSNAGTALPAVSRAIELPKHPLASVGGDWQIKVGRCVVVCVCMCVCV